MGGAGCRYLSKGPDGNHAIGLVATVAVSLCVLSLAPTVAQATFPGQNGPIAFTHGIPCALPSVADKFEIASVSPLGADLRLLTDAPCPDPNSAAPLPPRSKNPAYSPDGTKIAFEGPGITGSHIYVMNADGSGQRQLTFQTSGDDLQPAFSPNGTKIVFSSSRDNQSFDLYTIDVNGSDPILLTNHSALFENAPVYSPDGTKIAFDGDGHIFTMNANGEGAPTQLTVDTSFNFGADFSPDGLTIVFSRNQPANPDGSNNVDIYSMKADGSNVAPLLTGPANDRDATFSPDGSQIAFTSQGRVAGPPNQQPPSEIWTMTSAGADVTQITTAIVTATHQSPGDESPNWGAKVATIITPAVPPVDTPAVTPVDTPAVTPAVAPASSPPVAEAPPAAPPASLDVSAPRLSALSLSPSRFRAPRPANEARARRGTLITYRLSERALVRFRVQRAVHGRLSHGSCVTATPSKHRAATNCIRYTTLDGSFIDRGERGTNTLRFTGRLRGRLLRPGSYRLQASAKDAAGNRSVPVLVHFRIVKR